MWACPTCKRSFKNTNQQHTCKLVSKEELFSKRPANLEALYKLVVKEVQQFGDYREEMVLPDVIFFKTKSSFLAVKVKKDHLEVEFFLDYKEDNPLFAKFLQTSARRFAYVVKIDGAEEIDKQLVEWMRYSYKLINP